MLDFQPCLENSGKEFHFLNVLLNFRVKNIILFKWKNVNKSVRTKKYFSHKSSSFLGTWTVPWIAEHLEPDFLELQVLWLSSQLNNKFWPKLISWLQYWHSLAALFLLSFLIIYLSIYSKFFLKKDCLGSSSVSATNLLKFAIQCLWKPKLSVIPSWNWKSVLRLWIERTTTNIRTVC